MTGTTINNTDGFSFKRVWAFGSYYMPRLKWELIIYAAISLVCAILCILPVIEDIQMVLLVGVWSLLPILFYCGPLIFAKGSDTRILERLIPVSTAEKLTFYYIYTLVIIPIVVFLLPMLAAWIYTSSPALQTPRVMELYSIKFNYGLIWAINLSGGILISMVCLFFVEYARQNRMMFGIVGVIASNVFIGILGGIIGFVAAIKGFKKGFMDGLDGNNFNPEESVNNFMHQAMEDAGSVNPLTISILSIIIVMIFVAGWMTYRTIRERNL